MPIAKAVFEHLKLCGVGVLEASRTRCNENGKGLTPMPGKRVQFEPQKTWQAMDAVCANGVKRVFKTLPARLLSDSPEKSTVKPVGLRAALEQSEHRPA